MDSRNPLSSQVISNVDGKTSKPLFPARVVIPYQVRSYQTAGQQSNLQRAINEVVIPYQVRSYQT